MCARVCMWLPRKAAVTMARAEDLHRQAEQLRLQADRAKAELQQRERAAADAQGQARLVIQVRGALGRAGRALGPFKESEGVEAESLVFCTVARRACRAWSRRRRTCRRNFSGWSRPGTADRG